MLSELNDFIRTVVNFGLEHFGRYYALYEGLVQNNTDPEERGRVRVMVPCVGHTATEYPDAWVRPAMMGAGPLRGSFFPPEVGDPVWVSFAMGDPNAPQTYLGGWYGYDDTSKKTKVPTKEFAYSNGVPQRRGIVTRMGHVLQFCEEAGKEAIRLIWHQPDPSDAALTTPAQSADRTTGKHSMLTFDPDGSIFFTNINGTYLKLDAKQKQIQIVDENNNAITVGTDTIVLTAKDGTSLVIGNKSFAAVSTQGLTVQGGALNAKVGGVFLGDGADSPAVRGRDLMLWLSTHTHPTSSPGAPTAPPTPPPPATILSTKVLLK